MNGSVNRKGRLVTELPASFDRLLPGASILESEVSEPFAECWKAGLARLGRKLPEHFGMRLGHPQ